MHARFVAHSGVKGGNIVVGSMMKPVQVGEYMSDRAMFIDFGAAWIDRVERRPNFTPWIGEDSRVHLGTMGYRAPELLLGCPWWGRNSDAWSLG